MKFGMVLWSNHHQNYYRIVWTLEKVQWKHHRLNVETLCGPEFDPIQCQNRTNVDDSPHQISNPFETRGSFFDKVISPWRILVPLHFFLTLWSEKNENFDFFQISCNFNVQAIQKLPNPMTVCNHFLLL